MSFSAGNLTFSCPQCGLETSQTFRSDVLFGAPAQCPVCGNEELSVNRTLSSLSPLQAIGSLINQLHNRKKTSNEMGIYKCNLI